MSAIVPWCIQLVIFYHSLSEEPILVFGFLPTSENFEKCRCKCKELIEKGICDKGFIWNPSNCECE